MQKLHLITIIILTIHFKVFSQCNNFLNLGDNIQLCQGGNSQLDAGNTYDSYLWNDNSTNQTLNVNQSGNYHCTVTSTDETINLVLNGDFEQGNTLFTSSYTYLPIDDVTGPNAVYGVINNPNTWFNPFSPCPDHTTGNGTGNMMVLDGAISNGGTTAFWCQNITVSANSTYDFSYWAQSVTGAPFANIRVEINGVIMGSSLAPNIICVWEKTSYVWNSGASTSAQICLYNLEMGGNGNDFSIDDIGLNPVCIYSDTINVEIATADTIVSMQSICLGDSLLIDNVWQFTPGTYYEDIIINNCTQISEIILSTSQNPSSNAGENTTIVIGTEVLLNAESSFIGSTYSWLLNGNEISNEQTFSVKPLENTTYTLEVNRNGCSSSDEVTITVIEGNLDLLLPTAFSPNGDNLNDVFRLVNESEYESVQLNVYNRWGELIHSDIDKNHGWNGKYKDTDQALDIYIFYLKVKPFNKEPVYTKGTFTLIR